MAKKSSKKINLVLLILCIIPFGFDKLYMNSTKMFLWKCLLHFVAVGFIWWIYDLICVIFGKYKLNPLK